MSGVELVEIVSTTKAAERAASEPGAAAIGHADAAKLYALPVVASDIQDNPNNVTRFVVIAPPRRAAEPTGKDKTSVMFGVQDRPGALYDCLLPFHQAGLNLSRIESRPSRRKPWEYLFFIDIAAPQLETGMKDALDRLRPHTSSLEVLGSYPVASRPLNDDDDQRP
jgi:chorismate mutase/prephenate dehydratase